MERSAVDLAMALTCDVEEVWYRGEVAGPLTINIKEAFDGISQIDRSGYMNKDGYSPWSLGRASLYWTVKRKSSSKEKDCSHNHPMRPASRVPGISRIFVSYSRLCSIKDQFFNVQTTGFFVHCQKPGRLSELITACSPQCCCLGIQTW